MGTTSRESHSSETVTQRANRAIRLAMSGSDRVLPELASLAADPAESVRATAAEGLGLVHTVEAIPVLDSLLDDPASPVARNAAAAMFQLAHQPEALPSIRKMGVSPHADVRREAMGCALQLGLADGMDLLMTGLADDQGAIRLAAAETFLLLACASDLGARRELCERIADPARLAMLRDNDDMLVRRIFATALGSLGEDVPADWFEALSRDPDAEVRHQTVRSIARAGQRAARPALERALSDPEPGVGIAALQALHQWEGKLSTQWLAQLLHNPDQATRAYAVRLAEEFPPEESLPLLESALNDPDAEVAGTAAVALLGLRPEPALAWFRKVAQSGTADEQRLVVQRAGTVLTVVQPAPGGKARGAGTVDRTGVHGELLQLLESLLAHDDAEVRVQAARELVPAVDIADSPALRAALDDPEPAVRAAVADDLHTTRDVDLLVQALHNDTPQVRRAASSGLRLTRGTDLIGPLVDALDDDDFEVRWRAIELLGYAGRRTGMMPHRAGCRRLAEIVARDEMAVLREFAELSGSRIRQGSVLPAVRECWARIEAVLGVYACWAVDQLLRADSADAAAPHAGLVLRAEQHGDHIQITPVPEGAPGRSAMGWFQMSGTPARGGQRSSGGQPVLHVDPDAVDRVAQALREGHVVVEPAVARLVGNHLDTCRALPSADPESWGALLLAPYREAVAAFMVDQAEPAVVVPAIEDGITRIESIVAGYAWVVGLPWLDRDLHDARRQPFDLLEGLQALARRAGQASQAAVFGLAQAGLVAALDDPEAWRELLEHDDIHVRAGAAIALLDHGAGRSARTVGVLQQVCAPESGAHAEMVLHSALALAHADAPGATEPAVRLLLDPDPNVRDLAIRALAAMGPKVDAHVLRAALDRADDPLIRMAVAETFVDQGWDVPEAVLADTPDTPAGQVARQLLRCRLDDTDAWRELVLSLEDADSHEASLLAVQGIARARIRAGIGVLRMILKRTAPTALHALAAAGLMELDDDSGRGWVRNQLQDGHLMPCTWALDAARIAGRNISLLARGVVHRNQGRFLA